MIVSAHVHVFVVGLALQRVYAPVPGIRLALATVFVPVPLAPVIAGGQANANAIVR